MATRNGTLMQVLTAAAVCLVGLTISCGRQVDAPETQSALAPQGPETFPDTAGTLGELSETLGETAQSHDLLAERPAESGEPLMASLDTAVVVRAALNELAADGFGAVLNLREAVILDYEGIPGQTACVPVIAALPDSSATFLFYTENGSADRSAFVLEIGSTHLKIRIPSEGECTFVLDEAGHVVSDECVNIHDMHQHSLLGKVGRAPGFWECFVACLKRRLPSTPMERILVGYACARCIFAKDLLDCIHCAYRIGGPVVACLWECYSAK